jgi:Zn-dependent peptidase ImmA (M78 family)
MMPVRARYNRIDQVVRDLLASNDVSTCPVPVDQLAERAGAHLQVQDFGNEISGMLLRTNGQVIIAVEQEQSEVRQRFTIAHELGHLLLHAGQEVRVDTNFRVNFRDANSATAEDVEEIEANAFAARLLMPEAFLQRDLRGVAFDVEDAEQVGELASHYNVSVQAMTIRLVNLMNLHRL